MKNGTHIVATMLPVRQMKNDICMPSVCQVPKGAWHTVEVIEPSVIFEAKDGAYVKK